MPQRDYILRLIEQMGQVLVALRRRLIRGEATAAEVTEGIEKVASQTGIDLTLARAATPETLELLIAPTGNVEPGRCWLVAEMLGVDGLQSELEGQVDDARASYERAIVLFRLLEPGGSFLVGLPEAGDRVRDLSERLDRLTQNGPHEAGVTSPEDRQ